MRVCCPAFLLSFCIGGCTFDFTGLPGEAPASFSVQVTADTRTDELNLLAGLETGSEVEGEARIVLTDPIVAGVAIAPSLTQQNGTRIYEMQLSLSELAARGPLSIVAPDIDGVPSVQRQLWLPFVARIGSDSLFIAGDDPVVLRITDQVTALDRSQWSLLLIDTDSTEHVSIQATGYPPAEIVVPRHWFRNDASRYEVRLDVIQQQSGDFVPQRYRWSTRMATQIHWTVLFTAAANTPGS